MALPPGPRVPIALQTIVWWRRPVEYLEWCRRRYGEMFTIRAAPFGTIVYVADPAVLKDVFTGDVRTFHAGEANSLLGPVLGSQSLLLLDEDEHLRQRRLMLPPFHGESVRAYGEVMADAAEREVARWPVGEPFALRPRMQAITLEVILRAVFGMDAGERLERLRRALPPVLDINGLLELMWVWPRLDRFGPWRAYRRRVEAADALIYDELRARRAEPDLAERTDVLSLLMSARHDDGSAMTDLELRDELVTLLLAGHETTATGLAWAFERLLRNPAALARLREAVEEDDDDYVDAVVKETLRLRPVILDVARKLAQPVEVGGHALPAGITVMPAIGLVQSAAEHYESPDELRPERFLGGSPAPYTWIPFGGGPRRCLGAAFASYEMRIVLKTVLRLVELEAPDGRPERARLHHITMVPARGGRVRVRAHRAVPARVAA